MARSEIGFSVLKRPGRTNLEDVSVSGGISVVRAMVRGKRAADAIDTRLLMIVPACVATPGVAKALTLQRFPRVSEGAESITSRSSTMDLR